MIQTLYNYILRLVKLLINLIPSTKTRKWITGQKRTWKKLKQSNLHETIWVHVASSGEYEQAKPVIELLHHQGFSILLTFFSPSGYEAHNNNPFAEEVLYLPLDTFANAKKFIETVHPAAFLLVKYEFWLNYLTELNNRKIPVFLISAVFKPSHFLFQWYGKAHLKQVKQFTYIGVQDERSQNLLEKHNIYSEITGDTRIDRSLELPLTPYKNEYLANFSNNKTTIVLGSVWQKDLSLFQQIESWLSEKNIHLLIAPHELKEKRLQNIEENFAAQRISKATLGKKKGMNNLLIDKMGILKFVYRYADIAYIGGGFEKGIHNTLEPASYGIPVIFGPKHHKFIEAKQMITQGGAFTINNAEELKKIIQLLLNEYQRQQAGLSAKNYLIRNSGATKKVVEAIRKKLNVSNKSGE